MRQHRVLVSAIFVFVAACGQSETAPLSEVTNTQGAALATGAVLPPAKPLPNFAEEEGGTYYYVAAVSEEDRSKGKAAGDVVGFRYLGKNEKNHHVIGLASNTNNIVEKASCADPCSIIKYENGERLAFDPTSLIGAAFEDAMNGYMKEVGNKASRDSDLGDRNSQANEFDAPAPKSGSELWLGNYAGAFEGGADGDVTISGGRNGGVSVSLAIGAAGGCNGEISGNAVPNQNWLRIVKPKDDSGKQCKLSIHRRGDRLDISEDGCGYFRGFECSFNGEARRR